jgi:hypothetical protein
MVSAAKGASSKSRRGITTRSNDGRRCSSRSSSGRRRKRSRTRRLARLRSTALPSRREAMIPSRSRSRSFGLPSRVRKRVATRRPPVCTAVNSARRRRRSPRPNLNDMGKLRRAPSRTRALGRRDGQPFATFRAPPLQHVPTVFRAHPHEKTVSATAPAAIGLIRTFHWTPRRGVFDPRRNLNRNEPRKRVSMYEFRAGLELPVPWGVPNRCRLRAAVVDSPPFSGQVGLEGRFPQLWKNLWKSNDLRECIS